MSASKFECIERIATGQHIRHYFRGTATNQEEELRLSINEYKPRRVARSGDVTILAAPANGFPKEVYEPLWDYLLDDLEQKGMGIRGIWIADYVNQGRSGELNAGKLGTEQTSLSTFVGHPMAFGVGAIALRNDVWTSEHNAMTELRKLPQYRDWQPRCLELFKEFGLVKADPTQLPKPGEGAVTLRTTKHQEFFNSCRLCPSAPDQELLKYDYADVDASTHLPNAPLYNPVYPLVGAQLPHLLPSCQFIYGGNSRYGLPEMMENREARLHATGSSTGGSGGVKKGKVSETYVHGAGHCIPQEKPAELSLAIAEWFGAQLKQWKDEQAQLDQTWGTVEPVRRDRIDDDWMRQIQRMQDEFRAKRKETQKKQRARANL